MNRRTWMLGAARAAAAGGMFGTGARPARARQEAGYRSPYRLRFRHPIAELEVGADLPPWSSPLEESAIPPRAWYGREVERRYGAWGPPARQYPPPPGLERRDATWMQDRVIWAAARWIGYPYQHHHIPDWDPPATWPWLKVAYGRNSRGIDCSNFSSFYYNYGLGVKLDTGIRQQAERREVRGPGGRGILPVEVIPRLPYAELVRTLQPADLLYIRNDAGRVAHVILWLGAVGEGPDATPLILDSTGSGHTDADGIPIPIGVHIRPFTERSWYAHDFSHAHRIIRGVASVRPGTLPEFEEGGALDP